MKRRKRFSKCDNYAVNIKYSNIRVDVFHYYLYDLYFRNIMAASVGVLKNTILLGQVIPSTLTKAVKVQVPYFVYDDILGAYFKKTKDFVAEDSLKVC